MGQNESSRKIHIDNPNPPEVKKAEEKDSKLKDFLGKPRPNANMQHVFPALFSQINFQDIRQAYLKTNASTKDESTSGKLLKDEFDRILKDMERYYAFTDEHFVCDYEEVCKNAKGTLTNCLMLRNDQPLQCAKEVLNYLSCLLKCKISQQSC